MRAVVGIFARQRGGGGEEAGVAAHDHGAIDALQRVVVEIGAHEGLGDEAGRRRIAGRVVETHEVVVDRLGDVDRTDRMPCPVRLLGDDADGVGRIVAADIAEGVDVVGAQDAEDFVAIFEIGFVARRAQGGGRGRGDRLEIVDRFVAEVDEVLVYDAAHAVDGAVDMGDRGEPARLQRDADQRLIDHGRRPASLRHQNLVRHVIHGSLSTNAGAACL